MFKRNRIETRIVRRLELEKARFHARRPAPLLASRLNPALRSLIEGLKTPVFTFPS